MNVGLRVWAPRAARVELDTAEGRVEMAEVGEGWHRAPLLPPPGADYRIVLDGGAGLPDPRSRFQPGGVHAASRWVDPGDFPWSDAGWRGRPLPGSVLYELHVGTFTERGDFDGVVERLPHLVDLGVDAIELMPVAEFPGVRGWGYDGVDLYAPHHGYGGPDGLRRLVDAAHGRGIAVVLDVVYNHLGPDGNHLRSFGPYFTDRYHTPWGEAFNYDGPGSDGVRAHVLDNVEMWLREYHLDGLRLDAVHAIVDSSAVHLLEDVARRARRLEAELGRTLWIIAETDRNDPVHVRPPEAGGHGLDAQWSDDFHHALHAVLTGERAGYYADYGAVGDIATALRRGFVYVGRRSRFRERRHGRPLGSVPGHRLLGYLQNHDQVGNRAAGERISQLVSPGRLRVGAALVLTAPFTPMLFAGEEWGAQTPFQYFTDHDEAGLAEAVSRGRRSEFAAFGWPPEQVPDPQDPRTFARSRLDWQELEKPDHAALLGWYRALIRLRRSEPALHDGDLAAVRTGHDEARRWLLVERGSLRIASAFGPDAANVPVPPATGRHLLLSSLDAPAELDGDSIRVAAESVLIWREPA